LGSAEAVEESSSFFDEEPTEEDESIALSADEMGNITGDREGNHVDFDIDTEEFRSLDDTMDHEALPDYGLDEETNDDFVIEEDEQNEEEGFTIDDNEPLPDFGLFEDDKEDEQISLSGAELDNILNSEPEPTVVESEKFQFQTLKKQDIQKLMSYLDEKLVAMPEDFVKEFAQSEYFELYKKIMSELEL
jgi:DNA polymerase I-like protein with 3'-5' exonuclease and polymerase domains